MTNTIKSNNLGRPITDPKVPMAIYLLVKSSIDSFFSETDWIDDQSSFIDRCKSSLILILCDRCIPDIILDTYDPAEIYKIVSDSIDLYQKEKYNYC